MMATWWSKWFSVVSIFFVYVYSVFTELLYVNQPFAKSVFAYIIRRKLPILIRCCDVYTRTEAQANNPNIKYWQSSVDNCQRNKCIMTRKKHQNKGIEKAIKLAESHGWRVRKASGAAHPYAVLKCPHNDRKCRCGVFCQVSVWSTPRNPVAHARRIERAVENCIFRTKPGNDR